MTRPGMPECSASFAYASFLIAPTQWSASAWLLNVQLSPRRSVTPPPSELDPPTLTDLPHWAPPPTPVEPLTEWSPTAVTVTRPWESVSSTSVTPPPIYTDAIVTFPPYRPDE